MLPLTESVPSADVLLIWHQWVRVVAILLLAGLAVFAVFQFAAANQDSVFARYSRQKSLRSRLLVGLALVGTIPVIALVLILSERSAQLRMERLADRLDETSGAMAFAINRYLDKHLAGIESVASMISAGGDFSRAATERALMLHHAVYKDFLTMLTADAQGNVTAATSFMSGPLKPVEDIKGHNVADRGYFKAPMTSGQSYISDPFRGRTLGADPIVAVSAPLTDASGAVVGIVEGSMNLLAFADIDRERPDIDGAVMIVVDSQDRVIYATADANLPPLESVAEENVIATAALHGNRNPFVFEHSPRGERHRHMGVFANTANGWRVFISVPFDQVTAQLLGDYRVGLILLLAATAISLLFARAMVRRVMQSVRDTNAAIKSFSIDGAGDEVQTPINTATEFRPLFRAMRARSLHLRKAHRRLSKSMEAGEKLRRELTQAIALKDVEIAERTAELEEANDKLSGLSKTDPLTGVPNRRAFDDFEQRTWRHCAREKKSIAVVLMDIDFFKIYNDKLGHQAGDQCLSRVAQILSTCATRPMDLVARYGGEEFVAVLGGSTIHDALIVAERMRETVQDLGIEHPGSSHGVVTISVGIAAIVPPSDENSSSVVKAADEALYYAKAAGRNCVVFRREDEYVTYDADDMDLGSTGVLQILASKRAS